MTVEFEPYVLFRHTRIGKGGNLKRQLPVSVPSQREVGVSLGSYGPVGGCPIDRFVVRPAVAAVGRTHLVAKINLQRIRNACLPDCKDLHAVLTRLVNGFRLVRNQFKRQLPAWLNLAQLLERTGREPEARRVRARAAEEACRPPRRYPYGVGTGEVLEWGVARRGLLLLERDSLQLAPPSFFRRRCG